MTILIVKVLGIAGAIVLAGWLYWLTSKALLILTYAEQLLSVGAQLLGAVPGKSAPRTDLAGDPPPSIRYAALRAFAALRDRFDELTAPVLEDPVDVEPAVPPVAPGVELDRWADDGGADRAVAPPADAHPATRPTPRIDIAGGLPLRDASADVPAERDLVDVVLDRFDYANGHRRRTA